MDQARWQRIQALFVAALDLDPAEREDWLAATCGEDRELRDELLSLLAADASAPAFLDGSAADLADLPGGADPARGSIGPYELLRLIGAGGMGDVFLARRAGADFEQHVALKIIRDGFHSEEIIQRFQAERRILAQLEHPHIARLLDGGLTDDGRSYFTMEYVAGEPIDAYCAGRNATLDQRLALFQTVCAAVQHAQSKLIIHRDLKPSNVLVTPEGMVKLLDFGIAKLLDEDESAAGSAPS